MKSSRWQAFFSFMVAFVFCCVLFFGISFFLLRQTESTQSESSDPVIAAVFTEAFSLYIDTGEKQYLLDIKPQQAAAFLEPVTSGSTDEPEGTVIADKTVLRNLCEQLGGIDYTENGHAVKLTGQQLIDRYTTSEFDKLLKLLLTKAFKSRDTLSISYSVLTKYSATDISYVDFYENADALVGITVY